MITTPTSGSDMDEGGCVKGEDDFDVKAALEEMAARSRIKPQIKAVMPLEQIDKAIFEPTLPWAVRGFIVYHRTPAYERLCLENAGMKPKTLWATYGEKRVRLVGVNGNTILISPRGDTDAKLVKVSLKDLSDFGETR